MTADPHSWPSVCKCGATAVSPCNRSPCFRGKHARLYTPAEVATREAAAFQRGAEAMRDEAADYVADCLAHLGLPLGVASIRALPLPDAAALRARAEGGSDE